MLAVTTILVLSAPIVEFISVFLLPAVNNFVTKITAHDGLKIVVSAVTAFLAALLAAAIAGHDDGTAVFTTQLIYQTVFIFLGQMLVHRGVYKPLHVPQKLAPTVGLKLPSDPEPAQLPKAA